MEFFYRDPTSGYNVIEKGRKHICSLVWHQTDVGDVKELVSEAVSRHNASQRDWDDSEKEMLGVVLATRTGRVRLGLLGSAQKVQGRRDNEGEAV